MNPQRSPLSLEAISSAFMPSHSAAMPFRFPLQPPVKETELTVPLSSMSKVTLDEHTPIIL